MLSCNCRVRGLGLCLNESKIDLTSPRLALQMGTSGFTRAKLPIRAAFCSGTGLGLRSHNSQTCPTRFCLSELGNQVQIFRHIR